MGIKKVFYIFFLLGLSLNAQDSIPQVASDSTAWDVKVIRIPQEKIKVIPRGVRRIFPKFIFNKTKPLTKRFKRFVPLSFWTKKNELGLNISEVAFVNWNAGGDNSISALANSNFERNYKFRYISWENNLRIRYGLNAQEGRKIRKTEDEIRLSSTFGFRTDTLNNWYYSAKANFRTQLANGFKYPDRTMPISRFMAPGYLFLGLGTSYIDNEKGLNLYISPLTQKSTFVLDQNLSDQGSFGVEKGENVFIELGFLITNAWEKEVLKNVNLKHNLSLYTDYLKSFGNIDVDWELNFVMKINEFINANIGTHLIYDDDIKFDEQIADDGTLINPGVAKLQFKQLLGIGLGYHF